MKLYYHKTDGDIKKDAEIIINKADNIIIKKYHRLNKQGKKIYDLQDIRDCFDSEIAILEKHNER